MSAFIVRVPEAEACVGELRLRYDETAPLGVPAHITILFPFMSAERVSAEVLDCAGKAVRAVPVFPFRICDVGRFPGIAYLVPEPASPFVALTHALAGAFPEYPPYGGKHPTVIPHLSVATAGDAEANVASRDLSKWLAENGPIQASCARVTLLENSRGYWRELHEFALRGAEG